MGEMGIGRRPGASRSNASRSSTLWTCSRAAARSSPPVEAADIVSITEVRAELEGMPRELAALRLDPEGHATAEDAPARGRASPSAGRPGLADALRRAHPPVHLGGRPQPVSRPRRSSATSRTRCASAMWCSTACQASATRSTTRPSCSRRYWTATAPHARTIMREHVLSVPARDPRRVQPDLSPPGPCHSCQARRFQRARVSARTVPWPRASR